MDRKKHVNTLYLVDLYTVKHLTLRQIAGIVGMSAPGVMARLRRAGVRASDGTWVNAACAFCGQQVKKSRAVARQHLKSYCNSECYYASLEANPYRPWRQGSRVARALVAQHFALDPDHIVHHEDGDQRNNDLANLRVFASQADHMAYHRGRKVKPIWDGRTVRATIADDGTPQGSWVQGADDPLVEDDASRAK